MEIYVNGSKIDAHLEDEKTIGDVLKSFEAECARSKATTVNIKIDDRNISPDEFDRVILQELEENTKIEFTVVSEENVAMAFRKNRDFCLKMAENMKFLAGYFQSGNDKEANATITELADLIDDICHCASLSALFPDRFGNMRVKGKTFSEFFEDFMEVLKDFENAIESKDTVLMGDLGEYEISPRLEQLAKTLEV